MSLHFQAAGANALCVSASQTPDRVNETATDDISRFGASHGPEPGHDSPVASAKTADNDNL